MIKDNDIHSAVPNYTYQQTEHSNLTLRLYQIDQNHVIYHQTLPNRLESNPETNGQTEVYDWREAKGMGELATIGWILLQYLNSKLMQINFNQIQA